MTDPTIRVERAQNLWSSFARKIEPLGNGIRMIARPERELSEIGGLAGPKDEIVTYACAATSPQIYERWGTVPPSGLLMIGRRGSGKSLLAEALATQTETSLLRIDVPRLVLDVVHAGKKAAEMVQGWTEALAEMPPLTVFFDELEFSQVQEIGARRPDMPVGPIMDFLLELLDRTIAAESHLLVGATAHPETLREAFVIPGRFERIVEVAPSFPADIVDALQIHARATEKRAGRTLFAPIDWYEVAGQNRDASIGDWVRILHAVLRRKARCEAAGEDPDLANDGDFQDQVERFKQTQRRIRTPEGGNYV